MKVTSQFTAASVKIYINNILHIHFERSKFLGLSSWQYISEGGLYYIEITLQGGIISTDYDQEVIWLTILAELDKLR